MSINFKDRGTAGKPTSRSVRDVFASLESEGARGPNFGTFASDSTADELDQEILKNEESHLFKRGRGAGMGSTGSAIALNEVDLPPETRDAELEAIINETNAEKNAQINLKVEDLGLEKNDRDILNELWGKEGTEYVYVVRDDPEDDYILVMGMNGKQELEVKVPISQINELREFGPLDHGDEKVLNVMFRRLALDEKPVTGIDRDFSPEISVHDERVNDKLNFKADFEKTKSGEERTMLKDFLDIWKNKDIANIHFLTHKGKICAMAISLLDDDKSAPSLHVFSVPVIFGALGVDLVGLRTSRDQWDALKSDYVDITECDRISFGDDLRIVPGMEEKWLKNALSKIRIDGTSRADLARSNVNIDCYEGNLQLDSNGRIRFDPWTSENNRLGLIKITRGGAGGGLKSGVAATTAAESRVG